MAVMHMERFHICAMKRDRKKILEYLQLTGVVELKDVVVENDETFSRTDTLATRTLLLKNADTAARAAEIADRYVPQKKGMLSFLNGRTPISTSESDAFAQRREDALHKAGQILKLEQEVANQKAEVLRLEAQQESLVPWLDLPMPQTFTGTKKTAVFIGSLPAAYTLEELYALVAEAAPELDTVHIESVSSSTMITCFYVIVLKRDAQLAEEALRSIGFTRPALATSRRPREKTERLDEKIAQAQKAAEKAEEELNSFEGVQDELHLLEDHMRMRAEKYEAIEYLAQTKHVFILDGYIPTACAEQVLTELDKRFECAASVTPVGPDEEPPALLHNNKFSRPVESVLESYAMPNKFEFDPTAVMSIFYYVMFGLMFSDAGYGAILVVLTSIVLLKFKNIEKGMKMFINMFFWCGVSTVFWGVMFSSYFGDIVDVVSSTFFGTSVTIPPVWFLPLENPMSLLMFCFLIGIIHLTVGYIMKAVVCIKNGQPLDVLYETVFPVAIAYALILILMGTPIFEGLAGFMLEIPPMVVNVLWVVAAVSAVGIILTNGRESKNWGKRSMKGLYGLYNIIAGWLSDILSYSRLLALGLATGVIASVFNQLGVMFGGSSVVGVIVFILIFIVGQGLNFFINALGAYVHSNRLEFVEFFGKFYEGGGRKFEPLRIQTKYYRIEEETQNV